jgi:hypothetical protein
MTQHQKALVRYWFIGIAAIAVLLSFSDHGHFRLLLLLALPAAFVLDRTMRPPRLEGVPTPLEIMQGSRAWKAFLVVYASAAVLAAVLAVSVRGVGAWFSGNAWVLVPVVLGPLIGPLIQSQVLLYRAYGEDET